MKVLLDTCVLAELRHPQGDPAVKSAIALISDDEIYLSALVLGEIAQGVALLPDGRKRRVLNSWLTALGSQFADRIMPVDAETAHLWGDISARARQAGHILPVVNGLLAATALRHGLHLMTRTTAHLAATGALIIDPWKESEKNDEAE
jgi:predicted nucleic acid-binding protein